MGLRVAIAGASGYAGGELIRLVHGHPHLELGPLAAAGNAGRPLAEVHPQFESLGDLTLEPTEPDVLAEADVVLLALPHGHSGRLAQQLPADLPVVDLGADHRLADPGAWARYYSGDHAGTWAYGLPELPGARDRLRGNSRIANPGCYATAITLAIAPLLAANLVGGEVVAVAASGTSGAGRVPSEGLLASEVMGAISPYKIGGVHQHTPEIEQSLVAVSGGDVTLSFTPLLAPMSRGILATVSAPLGEGVDENDLRNCLSTAYCDESFVRLLAAGRMPSTAAVNGTNFVHLQVAADRHAGRAVVIAAIDNLVKGAAGQAIQNLNLALGLDETAGLTGLGVAP